MNETLKAVAAFSQAVIEQSVWNIIGKLALAYLIGVGSVAVINYIIGHYTDIGRDDTDPPNGRSDMKILTDHETGCQYLAGARGGLTPRLDERGRHICKQGREA